MTINRYDIMSGRKDNTGKTRYTKIGVMFPAKQGNGFTIKLEAYPLPNEKGEVWIAAFEPRENDAPQSGGKSAPRRAGAGSIPDDIEDSIPFGPEFR